MSANHRYSISTALLVLACAALTACSSVKPASSGMSTSAINPVNWITPYKVDVIQGNFVSSEQIDQLRVGMPREQVKAVLGTPLMASLFHADRWDYVFTMKRQGVEPQAYKYTVFFKSDRLVRFEGDKMPAEAEFISKLDQRRKLGSIPELEATEEQLKKAEKPSVNKPAAKVDVPVGSAATVYPPLEGPKQ